MKSQTIFGFLVLAKVQLQDYPADRVVSIMTAYSCLDPSRLVNSHKLINCGIVAVVTDFTKFHTTNHSGERTQDAG